MVRKTRRTASAGLSGFLTATFDGNVGGRLPSPEREFEILLWDQFSVGYDRVGRTCGHAATVDERGSIRDAIPRRPSATAWAELAQCSRRGVGRREGMRADPVPTTRWANMGTKSCACVPRGWDRVSRQEQECC